MTEKSPGSVSAPRPSPRAPDPVPLDLVVVARTVAAEGVVALDLADPTGAALPAWEPGAHVDLELGPDLIRQYSLCGDRDDPGRWRVAVLREPDGRGGSRHVHERIREGDVVRVVGPRCHFPLEPAGSYLFVAGGIGVTPLLAMIERLPPDADWRLLYGGRSRRTMAFVDELAAHGERVVVWPEDERGLLPLDEHLAVPRPDTLVYCCGPEPLLAAVEHRCERWPSGTLHVERFHARPGALDGPDEPFEVVLDASGTTVEVAAGETIVDALDRIGIGVPTSCREGTCGTCETEVLEGEPDHRDSFLSDEEKEAGETMMICCSRARSARIVLDL